MREILFRGIKTETKSEWIEGYLLSDREKQSFYICEGIGSSGVEVYDHTISQFTGLLDKNGVKIFEGDYIGWFDNKEKVEYFKYANDGLLKKVNKYGEFSLSTAEIYNNNHLEIIGNIHELK